MSKLMKCCKISNFAGIGKLSRQRLAKVLQQARGECITAPLVVNILKVPQAKACFLLSNWAKNGWLRRIRRGTYIAIDIAAESLNQTSVDSWILAKSLFSPCYIGGWSAAKHWDWTEQIFEKTVVFTPRRINGKLQIAGGSSFLISKITKNKMFGLKTVWIEQVKVQVSDPHKTIVDMLNNPETGGGMRQALDFFKNYLASSIADLKILISYADRMHNRTIFKRLGFFLSLINSNEIEIIELCRQKISKGYSQLDPQVKGLRVVRKWGLWIPENFEKCSGAI